MYSELDEIAVTVEVQSLSRIINWAVNEQQTVQSFFHSYITDAIDYLDHAQATYSETADREHLHHRQTQQQAAAIETSVKNACKRVRQYPVEIGYDRHWETFSDYTEALIDYLNDGMLEKPITVYRT